MDRASSITVSARPLSADERAQLHRPLLWVVLRTLPSVVVRYALFFGLMLAGLLAFAAIVTAPGAAWLGLGDVEPAPWVEPVLIAVLWLPVFVVPGYVAARKIARVRWWERQKRADLAHGRAEVVRGLGSRYAVGIAQSLDVLFVFEAGPRRVLVMPADRVGEDRALFGLAPQEDEDAPEVDFAHAERDPFGSLLWNMGVTPFPNSEFELDRLPHTGALLSIRTRGVPCAPLGVYEAESLRLPDARRYRRRYEQQSFFADVALDALIASATPVRFGAG